MCLRIFPALRTASSRPAANELKSLVTTAGKGETVVRQVAVIKHRQAAVGEGISNIMEASCTSTVFAAFLQNASYFHRADASGSDTGPLPE